MAMSVLPAESLIAATENSTAENFRVMPLAVARLTEDHPSVQRAIAPRVVGMMPISLPKPDLTQAGPFACRVIRSDRSPAAPPPRQIRQR